MCCPTYADAIDRGVVWGDKAAVEDVVVRERATQDAVEGEHLDGHSEVLKTEEGSTLSLMKCYTRNAAR